MEKRLGNLFLLPVLTVGLGLILDGQVTAQTPTTLYSFTTTSGSDSTNNDGAEPVADLIVSGNTLYGTAFRGGSSGNGTVFAVHTDGGGFTNLHSFTATPGPAYTNSDGAAPQARLILSGSTLYGTAYAGGGSGNGTVFAINTDGSGFTNLHSFNGSDGANPLELILSGNTLFGIANFGGASGNGTVFAINIDGSGFTNLHSFNWNDGADPTGLVLLGNILYGTTYNGGASGSGTVFAINTDGSGSTNLHSFSARDNLTFTNNDGAHPSAGLASSGNTLYGTAPYGGSSADGTVFAINTDGTGFTVLHSFTAHSFYGHTNTDGVRPNGLILSGDTLYGTAFRGGSSGNGTVFAINIDGSAFATLHSFTSAGFPNYTNSDGAGPETGVVLSGNTLYGTTSGGGSLGNGTVFSLFVPPQLAIMPDGTNVILTWPANATGFTLESTTDLVPAAVWNPVVPGPVVVNGRNTVTNPISGMQRFYRLSP